MEVASNQLMNEVKIKCEKEGGNWVWCISL